MRTKLGSRCAVGVRTQLGAAHASVSFVGTKTTISLGSINALESDRSIDQPIPLLRLTRGEDPPVGSIQDLFHHFPRLVAL